jgi:hypothetical protein
MGRSTSQDDGQKQLWSLSRVPVYVCVLEWKQPGRAHGRRVVSTEPHQAEAVSHQLQPPAQRRAEGEGGHRHTMAVGGLLRGLVSPPAWLPCHELFASWHHWLPSLPRLRPPASDGFKLLLVLLLFSAALAEVRYIASSSMAPTLRPGDRAVAEKVNPPCLLAPFLPFPSHCFYF